MASLISFRTASSSFLFALSFLRHSPEKRPRRVVRQPARSASCMPPSLPPLMASIIIPHPTGSIASQMAPHKENDKPAMSIWLCCNRTPKWYRFPRKRGGQSMSRMRLDGGESLCCLSVFPLRAFPMLGVIVYYVSLTQNYTLTSILG